MAGELSVRETAARALHPRAFDPRAQPPINFGQTWDEARAEAITEAIEDADRVLAAVADHDGLADVLRAHRHNYDSDCGMDYGCSCGAIDDYDESDTDHAAHLADVIRAWLVDAGELAQATSLVPPDTSTRPCEGSA